MNIPLPPTQQEIWESERCERCELHPAIVIDSDWATEDRYCQECYDNLQEAAYDRQQEDGEQFRGGEAAAYNAEQQVWIQRNLK